MAQMNKYESGKIYRLISAETNEQYIGSTIRTLNERLSYHKNDYKRYLKGGQHYVTSYEILKYVNAEIELIEAFPCENDEQLKQREGYYQRKENCVNKNVAGRTKREWYEDNKEKKKKYNKEYNEANRDKINAKAREQYRRQKEQETDTETDTE